MIIHNIETADMLTNGQRGTLRDLIRTSDNIVSLLVIELYESKAGENNRKKNPELAKKYPGCVFIERVSLQYFTGKTGSGASATLIQFPVRLSHAVTSHKIQGQSILNPTTVSMDIDSVFEAGQAYVILSRVQSIDQVFITKKFDDKKIKVSKFALEELKRLNHISFNQNPSPWHKKDKNALKIATVNCAGLLAHYRDIKKDSKLLQADIIHLIETSLPEEADTSDIHIEGFNGKFIKIGRGKGVATFIRKEIQYQHEDTIAKQTLQISKFNINGVRTISVYRSNNHSIRDTWNELELILEDQQSVLITGDFNICTQKDKSNEITSNLIDNGFQLMIQEATHIMGGHIDHVYWRDTSGDWQLTMERFSPYWTDHDALLTTVKRR